MGDDGALGGPAERPRCEDAKLVARAAEKRREHWLPDALEQLRCYLYLTGNARKLHATAKLVAAERRGELSASGDLVGHREGRSPLGRVARASPSGGIAQGRIGGCGGRLVFAAGHLGGTDSRLTQGGAAALSAAARSSARTFVPVSAAALPLVLRAGISSSWWSRVTARWVLPD